ncbi:MAG: HesB/IscA family protein [Chitinophagaceae bacterium]
METLIESPVKFTTSAVDEIKRIMQTADFDHSQTLKVGVKGGGCSGLSYILGFDTQKESDHEYFFEGLRFIMEKAHEMYLYGMEIDWQNGLNNRGFTFKNPNASTTCGCGSSFAV